MGKLVAKLKVKLREQAKGTAGYQFLAACKLFRSEVSSNRKGDRISAEDFRGVVEYKFGMKLDHDEVLSLFHYLVPGTGDSIDISSMVSFFLRHPFLPFGFVQFALCRLAFSDTEA